jgi:hypothetical protein
MRSLKNFIHTLALAASKASEQSALSLQTRHNDLSNRDRKGLVEGRYLRQVAYMRLSVAKQGRAIFYLATMVYDTHYSLYKRALTATIRAYDSYEIVVIYC